MSSGASSAGNEIITVAGAMAVSMRGTKTKSISHHYGVYGIAARRVEKLTVR